MYTACDKSLSIKSRRPESRSSCHNYEIIKNIASTQSDWDVTKKNTLIISWIRVENLIKVFLLLLWDVDGCLDPSVKTWELNQMIRKESWRSFILKNCNRLVFIRTLNECDNGIKRSNNAGRWIMDSTRQTRATLFPLRCFSAAPRNKFRCEIWESLMNALHPLDIFLIKDSAGSELNKYLNFKRNLLILRRYLLRLGSTASDYRAGFLIRSRLSMLRDVIHGCDSHSEPLLIVLKSFPKHLSLQYNSIALFLRTEYFTANISFSCARWVGAVCKNHIAMFIF